MLVSRDESFLRRIGGGGFIGHNPIREAIGAILISHDQLIKGFQFARTCRVDHVIFVDQVQVGWLRLIQIGQAQSLFHHRPSICPLTARFPRAISGRSSFR